MTTLQASMFQTPPGRPASVEIADGLALGRAGRERAYDNAGQDFRGAAAALVRAVAKRSRFFTMDEVRAAAEEAGLAPHHYNAWGSVLPAAAGFGWIRRRDDMPRRPSVRPEAHGNPNLVWESLIFEGEAGS